MNTDDMKFYHLVGMLKAEEKESLEDQPKHAKEIVFAANEGDERFQSLEDNMSLMARNFNKMLKHVKKWYNKTMNRFKRKDPDNPGYGASQTEGEIFSRKNISNATSVRVLDTSRMNVHWSNDEN